MSDSSDDEQPQLSAHTMAALQEFLSDQWKEEKQLESLRDGKGNVDEAELTENWKLGQFWYNDKTTEVLAREALDIASENGRIACLRSPIVYKKIREMKKQTCTAKCMESDERFNIYGEDFVFYDYECPVNFPSDWKNSFDIVIADLPFPSEECICKVSKSIKFLAKQKIILCTDLSMEEMAKKLLDVDMCKFRPQHQKRLQNDFRCYINYQSDRLNS